MFALKSAPFYPSTPSHGEDKKESPNKNSPPAQNIIQYNAQTVNFVQYMPNHSNYEQSSKNHHSNPPTDKQSKNYNQANYLR